jgi:hypothetical protein
MNRYSTFVEDGTVYVGHGDERVAVGPVADLVALVGGPAWTITYTEVEKRRYPGMDTSDEGLTVDVVDMLHTMTHGDRFVETLAALPAEVPDDDPDGVAPRLGLFAGKLIENLENGLD